MVTSKIDTPSHLSVQDRSAIVLFKLTCIHLNCYFFLDMLMRLLCLDRFLIFVREVKYEASFQRFLPCISMYAQTVCTRLFIQ